MLGLRPRARLESLLAADADPQDLLVPVADGLDLMPSESGAEALYALTPLDRARLHLRLTSLYDRFETVVIDAGPGIESPMRAMIRATRLIVVAVPEPASLTDAYALVKIATLRSPGLPIDLIVNRVVSEEEAQAASSRCALAARRFLRRDLGTLGAVPEEEALRRAARVPGEILRLTIEPIERIAERLIAAAPRFEGAMAPERTG
jgi:flagellar biosynthesis protein FlhG